MNLKNSIALMVLAVTVVGCASGVSHADYRATLEPVPAGQGRVWFYRPSKMMGAAVQPKVYLTTMPTGGKKADDQEWEVVGKAQAGCYFVLDRPPGIYGVKCTTEWKDERKVEFVEGEERYIRMTIAPGLFVGHVLLGETDAEKGMKEIQKCKLIDEKFLQQ